MKKNKLYIDNKYRNGLIFDIHIQKFMILMDKINGGLKVKKKTTKQQNNKTIIYTIIHLHIIFDNFASIVRTLFAKDQSDQQDFYRMNVLDFFCRDI